MSSSALPIAVLAEVGRGLAESLEYEATLTAIATLALPHLGSWCAVDVLEEDGVMRRVAVIHPEADKQQLARELETGWPPQRDDPVGVPAVMLTRQTLVVPHVDEAFLARVAGTPAALRALQELGIGSVITVPLIARTVVLGAITFVSSSRGHQYDSDDVALAEHLAALAALALDNARLHRAAVGQAGVEATNRAKEDFLAVMSHEIRTPINAILGYTEMLELGIGGPVSTQQREFLARVRQSSTHLVGLVTDVLDMAKADAGELRVLHEPQLSMAAVAAAIALVFPAAQEKGVRMVSTSADDADVSYVGDAQRVRQVLLNLLANAVRFTPRGGTVTVSIGREQRVEFTALLAAGGPWSYIRVADTGHGISPDHQATVFEPFVQVVGGLTRTSGGTGLGLTISRRLARLMGGDVTLVSVPGHGATFTLWLPAGSDPIDGAGLPVERAVTEAGFRAYGLAEIGTHVRRRVEDVLESVATRLRADPAFPEASAMRRTELEDHQLAFLTDVVQSLIVIDETGGTQSELFRAGSKIQLVVSDLHGRMRHRQGWSLAQLDRESAIVLEEIESLIHRHVPKSVGDVTTALSVIRHLIEQARMASMLAYRRAEQGIE